jgi:cytochrome c oxidase cbb3-type subunit III
MRANLANMFRALLAGATLASVPLPLLAQAPIGGAGAPPANAVPTPAGPPRGPQAVREFLGLGPAPDAAAAKRGGPIFAANCAFCHGPQARGAEGPSLIYSELVLKDVHGASIADFLKAGRPQKGMPSFATLSDEQRKDIAEFLHQQIEDVANRGTYEIKNIVLGNPTKGASYVAAHCLGCHSLTGDLKGLGAKWRPADLQRSWIMPPRTPALAITATVRDPQYAADGHRASEGQQAGEGQRTWEGRVQQIDDFRVSLVDESGQLTVVERNPGVTVELHDPLAPHVAMIGNLADPDMINVTAYLETLK